MREARTLNIEPGTLNRSLARQKKFGAFGAAEIVSSLFDRLSFGNIAFTLRVQDHFFAVIRSAPTAGRPIFAGEVSSDCRNDNVGE